jgi:hypothetical protein
VRKEQDMAQSGTCEKGMIWLSLANVKNKQDKWLSLANVIKEQDMVQPSLCEDATTYGSFLFV